MLVTREYMKTLMSVLAQKFQSTISSINGKTGNNVVLNASDISIEDEDENFDSENIEGALKEIKPLINDVFSSSLKGVKINDTDLELDEDKKVNIPLADETNLGVSKFNSDYGINMDSETAKISKATNSEIDSRTQQFKPITPNNLNYAVKAAITDENSIELNDTEKQTFREKINAPKKHENITVTLKLDEWDGTEAPYTQVITNSFITSNDDYIICPVYTHESIYGGNGIKAIEQTNGTIKFSARTIPTRDIPVIISKWN